MGCSLTFPLSIQVAMPLLIAGCILLVVFFIVACLVGNKKMCCKHVCPALLIPLTVMAGSCVMIGIGGAGVASCGGGRASCDCVYSYTDSDLICHNNPSASCPGNSIEFTNEGGTLLKSETCDGASAPPPGPSPPSGTTGSGGSCSKHYTCPSCNSPYPQQACIYCAAACDCANACSSCCQQNWNKAAQLGTNCASYGFSC